MKKIIFLLLPTFLFVGKTQAQALFEKVTAGPIVSHPSDSRSVNFVDVNNDGWDDIFITNGPQAGAPHLLYLNDGAGDFTQVTTGDIVNTPGPFDGATIADADNDGNPDIFAVTWYGAKNFLYFGTGDPDGPTGLFKYAADAVPSLPNTFSETAAWGDYDNDGLLDLYVTNSNGNDPNFLYRNLGGGVFVKITTGSPVTDARTSRSVNWVDFDGDCHQDLFVTNESNQPDDLYRNLGNGSFEKMTTGAPGQSNRSTMSSSWGDMDNDGDLDLFVANSGNFNGQNNQLFRNDNGIFTEITVGDLVTDGGCSFGSSFGDFDNDGDLDLVVSNGFCNGTIVNFLYRNDGQGNFTRDLESIADLGTPCNFGTAWGDFDNDGFLDLGFATCKNTSGAPQPANIFYRNLGNGNNWLKIKPVGVTSNRSAIGAKVWVTATVGGQEITQLREITSQSGYCGQNSLLAHVGLGDATVASEVRVQFGCGPVITLHDVAAGQTFVVTEGMATAATENLRSEKLRLSVSPNPASDTFLVEIFSEKPIPARSLQLHSASGQLFLDKTIQPGSAQRLTFPFSSSGLGLRAGVYFLRYGTEVIKLVVN